MQTSIDTLLSKFDNAVRQLGPVNTLVDKVVSRIAPTVAAKACGEGAQYCGAVACNPRSWECNYEGSWCTFKYAAEGGCGGIHTFYCYGCM
jgi:hypothetical protein